MQVRVFESADMASGLKQVRKELGPDALILSTRTVHNGKMGLLGKPTIEITAAIDNNWPHEEAAPLQGTPAKVSRKVAKDVHATRRLPRKVPAKKRINTTVGGDDITLDYGLPDAPTPQLVTTPPAPKGATREKPIDDAMRKEVDELKGLVRQLADRLAEKTSDTTNQAAPLSPADSVLRERLSRIHPLSDPVTDLLRQHGVDDEPAQTISCAAREHLEKEDLADTGKVRRFVLRAIESLVEVRPPKFDKKENQRRLALIGPTGVGKTTTLAKLAAHYLSNHSNSVALITIDTYRIAAVEQLKVYGEIMHLPVDVVISPEQLEKALTRHSDKELILIDTAGRSPRDTLSIDELSSFLQPRLGIEKHLVLSAATRESELLDAVSHFERVGIDRAIFTKVDECLRTGVILNIQLKQQLPLSYITNGQRVPEDLLQITRRSVAELILSHQEGIANE